MLKTITKSSNKKLGDIASTYRAGAGSVYSTCPNSCPLKPEAEQGSDRIDREYLQALLDAVPEDGVSWTYTHFSHEEIPAPEASKTTINISTDSFDAAAAAYHAGYPTVIVRPSGEDAKVDRISLEELDVFGRNRERPSKPSGLKLVRCPAEYDERITCKSCGSGKPLCARQDRNYVIKFTAHGSGAKRVGLRIVAEDAERQQNLQVADAVQLRREDQSSRGSREITGISSTDSGRSVYSGPLDLRERDSKGIGNASSAEPKTSIGSLAVSPARGGCYASNGPVHLQWRKAQNPNGNQTSQGSGEAPERSDGRDLSAFVRTLPPGSFIRHHVAGDIGC